MNKKGITLIETVISIFLVSVVIVTFLEALSVGITGTMNLSRRTTALNYAKSQLEHTKAQTYNNSTGDLGVVYPLITTGEDIVDVVNYDISGEIANVSTTRPLQQITVNVGYLPGKEVQLTGYNTDDGGLAMPEPRGLLVTDNILNVPTLPQGYSWFCAGAFKGYYHVFTTGTAGEASATWTFDWSRVTSGSSFGAPMIAIYEGIPWWVERDFDGEVREDGIVVRSQDNLLIGDLPGPGGNRWSCDCFDWFGICETYCDGESDPIVWAPHDCLGLFGGYPCSGACLTGHIYWTYDFWLSTSSGTIDNTMITGTLQPGTYTLLLFNAENRINLDTVTASIAYWY